jgi:hypothetical protein
VFQEVEAPRFQDKRLMKVVRLSALRTGCLNPLGNIPGTYLSWWLSQHQGHSATRRIMSMENSNDAPIRNSTYGNKIPSKHSTGTRQLRGNLKVQPQVRKVMGVEKV